MMMSIQVNDWGTEVQLRWEFANTISGCVIAKHALPELIPQLQALVTPPEVNPNNVTRRIYQDEDIYQDVTFGEVGSNDAAVWRAQFQQSRDLNDRYITRIHQLQAEIAALREENHLSRT
jgi:hypothetical protein